MANNKVMEAIVDISGSIDPSLGKAISGAAKQLDKIDMKSIAIGAAVAGVTIAIGKATIEAGKYLKELGAQFDNVEDSLRIGTGAIGDELEALVGDFEEVYKSVPTTMEDASKAIGDYNTRLGLTGPVLQEISKQAIQASDMLGDNLNGVITESSQAFQQWEIAAEDMSGAMDFAFKVSQSTGIGFTDLLSKVQLFGPQLQEMGYSFETAAALIGQLDKAGFDANEVLSAMKKSVTSLAQDGISAADGIAMYYEQIVNAEDAAKAAAIASKIFGSRAGSTMAAAIRNGALAVGDLTAELMANGETITAAAEDTYDYAENMQLFRQNLEVSLRPLANTVFQSINDGLPDILEVLEILLPMLISLGEVVFPMLIKVIGGSVKGLSGLVKWFAETDGALETLGIGLGVVTALIVAYNVQQAAAGSATALWTTISGGATVATTALGAAFTFLTSPIGLVILAIGAAIAAGVLLYKYWDEVTVFLGNAGDGIKNIFTNLGDFLSNIFKIPLNRLSGGLNTFLSGINKIKIPDWVPGVGGKGINIPLIPMLAAGGFTDGISIAGEAGTEAVLSFDPAYRKQNLAYWAQAGAMLGVADEEQLALLSGGSGQGNTTIELGDINFAPQITVPPGSSAEEILQKIREYEPEFIDMLLKMLMRREAGSYGPANSWLS